MTWSPPAPPAWVEGLNAHGRAVGGPDRLVGLDPDEMIETATSDTGLEDFGPPTWEDHYRLLVDALDRESRLHLVGRTIVRAEVLRSLRNRLLLADLWTRVPSALEADVDPPVVVVGTARSGTSILYELLACDPAHRSPATWELLHPAEAASGGEGAEAARALGHAEHTSWHDIQPEYESMHHNDGELPNECIFAQMNEFLSDHWSGVHDVPAYQQHLLGADFTDCYRYHRRILLTLQQRHRADRWLLKAPSHLATLPALFKVYPEVRIVMIHRDPLKTVPSTLSLMGTLKAMRCEKVDIVAAAPLVALGYQLMLEGVIDARASGVLPDDRFVDLRYADLMADPIATIARVYDESGWTLSEPTRAAMVEHLGRRPRGTHGAHRYALADFDLEPEAERARFARYQQHHAVPSEV